MNQGNKQEKIILVAEDEQLNFLLLKYFLEKNKLKFLWAKNGEEALDFCSKNQNIQLILMDLRMPIMDGLEATRHIKKFRPEIKIIAHTAYAMDYDSDEAISAGCDDYLAKPAKHEALLSIIKKYL
jgi:CheY-like chemotaxis protein